MPYRLFATVRDCLCASRSKSGDRTSGTQIWIGLSPCWRNRSRCAVTLSRVAFRRLDVRIILPTARLHVTYHTVVCNGNRNTNIAWWFEITSLMRRSEAECAFSGRDRCEKHGCNYSPRVTPQWRVIRGRQVDIPFATREGLLLPQPAWDSMVSSVVIRGFIARNGVRTPVGVSLILRVAEHTDEGPVRFPGTRYERQCILSCLKRGLTCSK